jgi:hypothetical protein
MDHLLRNANAIVPLAKIDKIDAAFREREFARGQSAFVIVLIYADKQTMRVLILPGESILLRTRKKTTDELSTWPDWPSTDMFDKLGMYP